MEGISAIDFHTEEGHLIQACGNILIIFKDGDTSEPGCEIENSVLRRILAVAQEQIESDE